MTHDHSTGKGPEEFDLEALRLHLSQLEATSAKIPISVPCHKPPRHDWIRVHQQLQIAVGAIVLKEDRDELYIVAPAMASAVGDDLTNFTLHPYIARSGVVRLWPVRLPSP